LNRFILPDYPHSTRFLSSEEKAVATRRMQGPGGSKDAEKSGLMIGLKLALTDYKVWLLR
jgi:hypothetical protein